MSQSTQQRVWIPPLPQGWDARYDHGQRRYFFINHQTKQTQWEDPRFSSHGSSSSSAGAAASASVSLGSNTRNLQPSHAKTREHVPMRELSPRRTNQANRGSSHHHQEESSLSRDLNKSVINGLHQEFPKASKELIADMYTLCHENVRETREQLKDMGYHKARPPQHQQHQPSESQHQEPEVEDTIKQRLFRLLKVDFPNVEDNLINMALSSCEYRLEDTKRVLQAVGQPTNRPSPTTNTSSMGPSATARSEPIAFVVSLDPEALPSASENSPQALSAGSSSARPMQSTIISCGGRNNTAGPSRADRIGSGAQQLKASDVTKKKSARAPRKKQTVVTSQPAVGGHVNYSSHRTEAKGPDASLRKGPDSSLLINDYEHAQGPDRSLRQGPDHSRASGPLGAKGADPSLRCGPQSSLLQNQSNSSVLVHSV